MKPVGSGGRGSLGQFDKLILILLGLVVVIVVRTAAPAVADRLGSATTPSAASATATPTRAPGAATATPDVAVATATPAAAPTAQALDPPWFRISAGGSGANMRQAPSRSAPVVGELKDGTVVDNLNEQRTADGLTWQHIKEGTVDGWVAAELLVPQRE